MPLITIEAVGSPLGPTGPPAIRSTMLLRSTSTVVSVARLLMLMAFGVSR